MAITQNVNNHAGEYDQANFDDVITCHKGMRELVATAKKVARSEVTVLLTGESGTGKQLFAHAIHNASARKNGPFVDINCAGMPDNLLESELFGHERGAFTDAVSRKRGKFELADGGTIFLDEIGDMSIAAQAKTLKVVEEKRFERVGGEESVRVNCRIIAATNKDLSEEARKGHFRQDLYYRLHEASFNLLPLRTRKDDIPLLIAHYIEEFNRLLNKNIKGVSQVALAYLMRHDWPGNTRELKSLIKSSMVVADRDTIWLEDMPFKVELNNEQIMPQDENDLALASAERKHILKVLNYSGWNKVRAAKLLGISRPTLDAKIKRYKLKTA